MQHSRVVQHTESHGCGWALGSAHAAGGLENILLAALSPLSLKIVCIGNTNFLLQNVQSTKLSGQ